ncbi:MAG: hypothetical protein E7231_02795 [Cellulosilyticum sp.]|nr:hypothetical protein [Cellulosilyticum sp.]
MKRGGVMKQRELAIFCRQLAQIAGAGMRFEEGLRFIIDEEKEKYIPKRVMIQKLEKGEVLVDVLEQEKLFSVEMLEMIAIGMQTGNLEEIFNEIADYYEHEINIKEQVKNAFYYPLILGSILLVVMSILMIKVLPIFKEIYKGMNVTTTGFTKWLFEKGSLVGIALVIVLIGAWFIVFVGNFCTYFKQTKALWKRLTNRNQILELIDLIRLTRMLSLLIKNGQSLDQALLYGEGVVRQENLKEKLQICRAEIITSSDLMQSLNKGSLFKPFIRKSLVLALKTGRLESSLKEASSYYEKHLEKTLLKGLSIIEPVSVGIISIILGSILFAVMIPLMNLINAF